MTSIQDRDAEFAIGMTIDEVGAISKTLKIALENLRQKMDAVMRDRKGSTASAVYRNTATDYRLLASIDRKVNEFLAEAYGVNWVDDPNHDEPF